MNEYQLIKGMTVEAAKRYFKVRKELDLIINRIHTFGELISMDKDTEQIGSRIKSDSVLILRMLDVHFVYLTDIDFNGLESDL
ncbi:MAG: hypothetical protein GY714_12695 [Desulfobacterales bacterium]|nr:hypothetical protein [Desulfobacterales bacterium]